MPAAVVALAALLVLQSCAAPIATTTPSPAATEASAQPTSSVTPETPRPPPAPTATPFSRCTSPGRVVADISLANLCIPGADAFIEASIGGADLQALFDQIEEDLAEVQREFAWTLRGRPAIDVFATNSSYTTGLVNVFGYSGATAAFVADNSVSFFEPALRTILVDWEAVRERRPIAAIRHELTHYVTLEACVPHCDLVPAWLNEGQARLAEATIPGDEWRLVRVRYEAASMVATKTLFPLSALVSQIQWNNITSWGGYYKYQEAARATELLRADIGGTQPIAQLYDRMRRGEDVARAYATLTGRTFDSFIGGLAARFADAVPAGPAIVMTPGPQADHGLGYLLYGFGPEQKVTVRLVGRRIEEWEEVTVSPQGAQFSEVADRYPPGTYVLAVTSGETVIASAKFEKRGGRPLSVE